MAQRQQPEAHFFQQALTMLGATSEAQAAALGVSRRTIRRYGRAVPRAMRVVMEQPTLVAALLVDALVWQASRPPPDDR